MGLLIIRKNNSSGEKLAEETRTSSPSATWGGTLEGNRTFNCMDQIMPSDLTIGGKTLRCKDSMMPYNVWANYTKKDETLDIEDMCEYGCINSGCGYVSGNKAMFYNGNYNSYNYRYRFWDTYDQNLTHSYFNDQEVSNRNWTQYSVNMGGYLFNPPTHSYISEIYPSSMERVDSNGTLTKLNVTPQRNYIYWGEETSYIVVNNALIIYGGYRWWEDETHTGNTDHNDYVWKVTPSGTCTEMEYLNYSNHMHQGNCASNGSYGVSFCTSYRTAFEDYGYISKWDSNFTRTVLDLPTSGTDIQMGFAEMTNTKILMIGGYIYNYGQSTIYMQVMKYWNMNGTYGGQIDFNTSFIAQEQIYKTKSVSDVSTIGLTGIVPGGDFLIPTGFNCGPTWYGGQSRNLSHVSENLSLSSEVFFKTEVTDVQFASNGKHLILAGGSHYDGSTSTEKSCTVASAYSIIYA